MKNFLILTAVLVLGFAGIAMAQSYDVLNTNIVDVTDFTGSTAESTDQIQVFRTGSSYKASQMLNVTDIAALPGVSQYEDVIAANTLTAAECGKISFLNASTEFSTVLPSPTAGCEFEFVVKAAPSGANYTIDITGNTGNEIIKGHNHSVANTNDDAATGGADRISFVQSAALAGDRVKLTSDGTNWFAVGFTSAAGAVTFTSSN